jgi:hypothetical protein
MGPSIFKVEAMGDTLYIEAWTEADAKAVLFRTTGPIPDALLQWETVTRRDVPLAEEILR